MSNRKYTVDRMRRAFKILISIQSRMSHCEMKRDGGAFGIAVHSDFHAKEWRKMSFRRELLTAWINDNPICWYNVYHLSAEDMAERSGRLVINNTTEQSEKGDL